MKQSEFFVFCYKYVIIGVKKKKKKKEVLNIYIYKLFFYLLKGH